LHAIIAGGGSNNCTIEGFRAGSCLKLAQSIQHIQVYHMTKALSKDICLSGSCFWTNMITLYWIFGTAWLLEIACYCMKQKCHATL